MAETSAKLTKKSCENGEHFTVFYFTLDNKYSLLTTNYLTRNILFLIMAHIRLEISFFVSVISGKKSWISFLQVPETGYDFCKLYDH